MTGRSAGRLAGAVSLLLALLLIAGVTPAVYAGDPPTMPHQFYGTVSYDGTPVAEDTLVEAFVAGVKEAQTAVDGEGRYGYDPIFTVPGTSGAEVTFRVGGVLANETATWQSGKIQQLNLTINEEPAPPVPRYALSMAVAPADSGTATDVTAGSPYLAETEVSIKAEAEEGYRFVNWTAPAGSFADANAAETIFTMPAEDATVTANFVAAYTLTMAVSPDGGGTATDVTDAPPYPEGTAVSIRAQAASGYGFGNWTAPAGIFDDATAAETTFTMPAQDVIVTANFEAGVPEYALTMAANPEVGGNATDVTAASPYAAGTVVNIKADAEPGYAFENWTAPAGVFGNATVAETTFTMPAQDVTVTANFRGGIPTVATEAASNVLTNSVILNMRYTAGNFTPVEVRFAMKEPIYEDWYETAWVSRTADGTHSRSVTGLQPYTEYEFKAQLKHNDTVIEGATLRFTTAPQPNLGMAGMGCFIATAAYGSQTAEQIDVLRDFRDVVLLESTLGSRFVTWYYRTSPPIAEFIGGNEVVRLMVREFLVDPLVWLVKATGTLWHTA